MEILKPTENVYAACETANRCEKESPVESKPEHLQNTQSQIQVEEKF